MLKFCLTLFLFLIVNSANHFRLNTKQKNQQMKIGDSLISTLGYFKATLQKTGCILKISMFDIDASKYTSKGNFKSNVTGDCQYLNITQGKVITNSNASYMEVKSQSFNDTTILTIDDQGVIRLIGTFIMPNRVDIVSKEKVFDQFKVQQKYLRSRSISLIDFGDRFQAIQNNKKWKFIAQFGQLTIYYGENPAMQSNYVYSSVTIRDSRIYDFANQTFPGILYNNITFQPRCFEPRLYLDFKPPYTFSIDPYWPIVRVYEQGGYKLLEIAYSKLAQHDFEQNIMEVNYHHTYTPCPPRTFEFKGDCVAKCPSPYYHQIRGESGFCVLNCEQYANIDMDTRVCSCVTQYQAPKLDSKNINKCPNDSSSTPYGCVCKNGFYDGILTFTCVTVCPSKTIGISGLCMKCPYNCKTCQRDGFHRRFLQCKECQPGFKILQLKGQCVKTCITYYGNSLMNGICQKCADRHCVDCSNDPNVCLKCDILNTLNNGTCNSSCLVPSARQVYSQFFSTKCLPPTDNTCIALLTSHYLNTPFLKCDECFIGIAYLDQCVDKCPVGYYAHNSKFCACSGVNNMTIHNKCMNLTACPITMSFDIRTHSCLSCPFGCMSCINTQCTSCNPGYFLYISPQTILCRRKSPIFPCDNQYVWKRDSVCLVKQYNQSRLAMTLCRQNIPDCQICIPQSRDICVLCQEGFFIYNNTCIDTCKKGLIQYDNTCILPEIVNCSTPHLQSIRRSTIVTIKNIEESQPYRHYIYGGQEAGNDPVGYIPSFQKLTTLKNDGIPRQTSFFEPEWICLKCNDGYGMSMTMKNCMPCPHPCITCYFAQNNSCIKKIGDDTIIPSNKTCPDNNYKDSETGECIKSCNDPKKYPEIKEGVLYCQSSAESTSKNYLKIDVAIYPQNDNTSIVVFAFSQKIETIKKNNITTEQNLGSFDIEKINVINSKVSQSTQSNDSLQQNQNDRTVTKKLIDNQYLLLDGESAEAYILNLSNYISQLRGMQSGSSLPNSIYGVQAPKNSQVLQKVSQSGTSSQITISQNSNHRIFMTAWLAYIGYIMAIVIILLHAVFIGTGHLYKADNLLIFCQTIFFFSFSRNFVGRLLSQYYYGWSWAHARFLPNLFSNIIPDGYTEIWAPPSYRITVLDGNFFRNSGYSLAWGLIFIGAWLIITAAVYGIGKLRRTKQLWYFEIAQQSFFAGIQFFTMNLLFFSYSQLNFNSSFNGQMPSFKSFYTASQALSIVMIVLLSIYAIVRFYLNNIAGLYMFKRILIPAILFASYQKKTLLVALIILEVVFMISRFIIQLPEHKKQKMYILIQSVVFVAGYFLMFLCTDAGVNTIIISIIVFLFIVYLAYDLTTIYLEFRQEYSCSQIQKQIQSERQMRAKTVRLSKNDVNSNKGSFFKKQSTLFPTPTVI